MAEAVKDLPDPLEEPANEAGSSPDDLLSKLADDAITQLIENDSKGIPPTSAAPIEVEPAGEPAVEPLATETAKVEDFGLTGLADIATESQTLSTDLVPDSAIEPDPVVGQPEAAAAATPEPVVPTATEQAEDDVQSQLDSVLTELKSDAPVPTPVTEVHAAAHAPASEPDSRADIKARFDHNEPPAPIRHDPPDIIVKPLQWMNLPFSSLPDSVRDTLGQIGIITIINALAVLIYVIFFKKP